MESCKRFVYGLYFNEELLYVGSTKDLKKRYLNHKSDCFNTKTNRYNVPLYRYIRDNKIEFKDIQHRILREVDNITKKGIEKIENEYITELDPKGNGQAASGFDLKEWGKEYREKNKDKINEWREKNKEKIKEKRRERFTCPCGGRYVRGNKKQHEGQKKHRRYIEKINITINIENLTITEN